MNRRRRLIKKLSDLYDVLKIEVKSHMFHTITVKYLNMLLKKLIYFCDWWQPVVFYYTFVIKVSCRH